MSCFHVKNLHWELNIILVARSNRRCIFVWINSFERSLKWQQRCQINISLNSVVNWNRVRLQVLPSLKNTFKKKVFTFICIKNFLNILYFFEGSLSLSRFLFWYSHLGYCSVPFRRLIFLLKIRGAAILRRGWACRVLRAEKRDVWHSSESSGVAMASYLHRSTGHTVIRVCCVTTATHNHRHGHNHFYTHEAHTTKVTETHQVMWDWQKPRLLLVFTIHSGRNHIEHRKDMWSFLSLT